jgi:hypothetical protein
MRRGSSLRIGKVYRLAFPGIAARVIEPPANAPGAKYPYLVESVILRSRWWVNDFGEPDNIHSPHLIVATSDEDANVSAPAASVGASIQGYVSGGK